MTLYLSNGLVGFRMSDASKAHVNAILDRAREAAARTFTDYAEAMMGLSCCIGSFRVTLEWEVGDDLFQTPHTLELLCRAPVKGWLAREVVRASPETPTRWRVTRLVMECHEIFSCREVKQEVYDELLMKEWIPL